MRAGTIIDLAARAADVAVTDGGDVLRVEMGEMADGSGRAYALVTTLGGGGFEPGVEQEFRVTTPAPRSAPPWATRRFHHWTTEERVSDDEWIDLGSPREWDVAER